MNEDIEIVCAECTEIFIFTEREQRFFADRKLHQPKRCKACRDYQKSEAVRMSREQIGE